MARAVQSAANMPSLATSPEGIGQRPGAGREDEDRIAVEGRVHRADGPGDAVLGHDRDAPGLGLGQGRRRWRPPPGWCWRPACPRRHSPERLGQGGRGRRLAAQLAVLLAGPRPRRCGSSGMVTEPKGLATARAPTVTARRPPSKTKEALPSPPLRPPATAPRPAPALPSAKSGRGAASAARRPRSR